MIEITGVKKSFHGVEVLKDINLKIEKGDIFGLIGLSGAGKSTLLRCISGLETFDEGSITINGINVKECIGKNNSVLRKNTGMIFQQFSLLNRLNVYENIALPMKCWKYSKEEIDKRVRELLHLVGLEDKIHAKPRQLSGGQKQRVAIARALTMEPDVLFCDEATSALDPITTESILTLLKSINQELGVTIVVVTHEMSVVKSICNRVAVLKSGNICEVGNVDDIFLKGSKSLLSVLGEQINGNGEGLQNGIKVIFRSEEDNQNLLSRISNELSIDYTISWSSFDTYQGKTKGYYILNVDDKDRESFIGYLEKNKIEYKEMSDSGNGQ